MSRTTLRRLLLPGALALMLPLAGCLESSDVTLFCPGVYKGADDPLTETIDSAALRARFDTQRDR